MSTMTQNAAQVRSHSAGVTATDLGIFVVRLGLGVIFFAHGAQKLLGWFGGAGLSATVQGFAGSGIPPALAYLAIFTEFFGGLAVLIGLCSRVAALGLTITMLVAIFKVHLANGFFLAMKPGEGNGIEYNVALIAMALMVVIAGPGRLALADPEARLVARRLSS